MKEVLIFFSNEPILALFESFFIIILIIACYKDLTLSRKSGNTVTVSRGDTSLSFLYFCCAIAISTYFSIVQISCIGKIGKYILTFFDLIGILYLFLKSSWFRNEHIIKWLKYIQVD